MSSFLLWLRPVVLEETARTNGPRTGHGTHSRVSRSGKCFSGLQNSEKLRSLKCPQPDIRFAPATIVAICGSVTLDREQRQVLVRVTGWQSCDLHEVHWLHCHPVGAVEPERGFRSPGCPSGCHGPAAPTGHLRMHLSGPPAFVILARTTPPVPACRRRCAIQPVD